MMRLRIYIDTSVVGGCMDAEFQSTSQQLINRFRLGEMIAVVSELTELVSWNFKHIVNLQRIHGYNSVNLRYGYPLLEIRSPLEVIIYD